MTDIQANKQLVHTFLKSLYELNLDTTKSLMHPDCEFHIPNVTMRPDRYSGPDMISFLRQVGKAIPDGFRFDIVEMTAEDNRVSTVVNAFAKTIDDTDYNNRYHFLHYIEDGKIIKQLEYIDSFLAAKVMGPILLRLNESS